MTISWLGEEREHCQSMAHLTATRWVSIDQRRLAALIAIAEAAQGVQYSVGGYEPEWVGCAAVEEAVEAAERTP